MKITLRLPRALSKLLWGIFAIVFIIVFVVTMIKNPAPEHVEDTNGADNYALQTITEEDVIVHEMGMRGGVEKSESEFLGISGGVKYEADKFTGIYVLNTETVFAGSDIHVTLSEYKIESGNFGFYVVMDDAIIGQIEPNEDGTAEFLYENIENTGVVSYVLAGESAGFAFKTTADQFS